MSADNKDVKITSISDLRESIKPCREIKIHRKFGNYTHHLLVTRADENQCTIIQYASTNLTELAKLQYPGEISQFTLVYNECDTFSDVKKVFDIYEGDTLMIACRNDYPNTQGEIEDVIRRAESRLGEKKYSVHNNNCESFVNWALTEKNESKQIKDAGVLDIAVADSLDTILMEDDEAKYMAVLASSVNTACLFEKNNKETNIHRTPKIEIQTTNKNDEQANTREDGNKTTLDTIDSVEQNNVNGKHELGRSICTSSTSSSHETFSSIVDIQERSSNNTCMYNQQRSVESRVFEPTTNRISNDLDASTKRTDKSQNPPTTDKYTNDRQTSVQSGTSTTLEDKSEKLTSGNVFKTTTKQTSKELTASKTRTDKLANPTTTGESTRHSWVELVSKTVTEQGPINVITGVEGLQQAATTLTWAYGVGMNLTDTINAIIQDTPKVGKDIVATVVQETPEVCKDIVATVVQETPEVCKDIVSTVVPETPEMCKDIVSNAMQETPEMCKEASETMTNTVDIKSETLKKRQNSSSVTPAAIVLTTAVETCLLVKKIIDIGNNKLMDSKTKNRQMTKEIGSSTFSVPASMCGATVGQALIPVPILGGMIGGYIGRMIGRGIGGTVSAATYDAILG